jgi:hypothetical protein
VSLLTARKSKLTLFRNYFPMHLVLLTSGCDRNHYGNN